MLETLFGSLLGGVFRIVPEVMKLWDKKDERKHELAMLDKEMDFAKTRGEIEMRRTEADMTVSEMSAITEALKGQSEMAKTGGKFVSAISALVRPLVTYWFVFLYSLVKIATMLVAFDQNGDWKEVVISIWTKDDAALLMMILTFWFVGRVWESRQSK